MAITELSFTVTKPEHEAQGLSLFAHGAGTKVKITNSNIHGGVQAAAVHHGASLDAEQLQCSGCTFAGAITSLHLEACLQRQRVEGNVHGAASIVSCDWRGGGNWGGRGGGGAGCHGATQPHTRCHNMCKCLLIWLTSPLSCY